MFVKTSFQIQLGKYFFLVLLSLLTVGLIISEQVTLLILVPAAFLGIVVLVKPIIGFWLVIGITYLGGPIVSYIPGTSRLIWAATILLGIIGINIIFRISQRNIFAVNSTFCRSSVLLFCFIIFSILTSLVNTIDPTSFVVAFKNYFQFIPILLFVVLDRNHTSFYSNLFVYFLLVGLLQIPTCLLQYFFIVPEVSFLQGVIISVRDCISGTFGTSLLGGGVADLGLFMCFLVTYYWQLIIHKKISLSKGIFIIILHIVPLALAESKITLLYLFAISLMILPKILKSLFSKSSLSLILLGCIVGVFSVTSYLFVNSAKENFRSSSDYVETTFNYNFGNSGYGIYRLNRMTCLEFWYKEHTDGSLLDILVGHGLDSTNEAETANLGKPGYLAVKYPLYGLGLTMISKLLWETGLIGLALFIFVIFLSIMDIGRVINQNNFMGNELYILLTVKSGFVLYLISMFSYAGFRNSQLSNSFLVLLLCFSNYFVRQSDSQSF